MYTVEYINHAGDLTSRTFVRLAFALVWLDAMADLYGAASLTTGAV